MKPRKNTVLIMLLGLLLFAFAAGMAQSPAPSDQKKAEACCSMESCCCNGGSCPIHDGANSADAKKDCCCKGDSCEMKNHSSKEHPACCADSCDMKHEGKHDAKGGDCCKIKTKAKEKQKAA